MEPGRFFPAVSPRRAKALVCVLTAIIAAIDFSIPARVNLASFYFICIVLLIWARSVKWLWASTAVFILLTFAGVALPIADSTLQSVDWMNRIMTGLALAAAAVPVHLRIRASSALELASAERNRAQRDLQESYANLETRIQERTRELSVSEQSLRQLSIRLITSQDEERRRIARELHDSVGQYLSYSKILVESWLKENQVTGKELKNISEIVESLEHCLTETRSISHLLHPPLLDELGFGSAAKLYVDGFANRSGIKCNLTLPSDMKRLPPAFELVLFRILQESLTNIMRHAHSAAVDIQVQSEGGQIALFVRDYGKGMPSDFVERFNKTGEGGGVGMSGMRERVRELRGNLRIESSEKGTMVCATLPSMPIEDSEGECVGGVLNAPPRTDSASA